MNASADDPPPTGDEVVVRGDAPRQLRPAMRDPTLASTLVTGEALRAPGASVADVLRGQPGVQVQASGASSDTATLLVRGASSAQLPVYLAGVRINDDVSGSADLSTVPTWLVERIEIYRGDAPVDADRLGIGGAVFIDPRLPREARAGVSLGAGSFGWNEQAALVGAGDERAKALFAVDHQTARNDYLYLDDRATIDRSDDRTLRRQNADSDALSTWSIGEFTPREGTKLTALVTTFTREQGSPGIGSAPALHARLSTRRTLAALRAELACGPRCSGEVGFGAVVGGTVLRDPAREISLDGGAGQEAVDARRLTPSARVAWGAGALRARASAEGAIETIEKTTPSSFVDGARRASLRPALTATWDALPRTTFSALGALEYASTDALAAAASPAPVAVEPSGRVSARYGDDAASASVNAGRYARLPTLGELYGQSSVVRGNASLIPEAGVSLDAGVRASRRGPGGGRLEADAFGYVRSVDELIAYRRSSFSTVVPYNVGSARLAGAEVAAAGSAYGFIRLKEALTLLDARDTTADRAPGASDVLPFRSRMVSATTLTLTARPGGAWRALEGGAVLLYQSSRTTSESGYSVIPAETSVDLQLLARFGAGPIELTLRARAANVTGAALYDVVGYPLPPRQFYLTLEASYEP